MLFGIALRMRLAPSPAKAKCLEPEERLWLQRRQDDSAAAGGGGQGGGRGQQGESQVAALMRK